MTALHREEAELAAAVVSELEHLAAHGLAHQEYTVARRAMSALRHVVPLRAHLAELADAEEPTDG